MIYIDLTLNVYEWLYYYILQQNFYIWMCHSLYGAFLGCTGDKISSRKEYSREHIDKDHRRAASRFARLPL